MMPKSVPGVGERKEGASEALVVGVSSPFFQWLPAAHDTGILTSSPGGAVRVRVVVAVGSFPQGCGDLVVMY